ncbi:hypothetical protein EAS64_02485 [Trebonia kvetii]|uniref:Uncharacterized protein n=1 Tax=Trebonia kvetii TaxID=2480626 RepID=A0A6P2C5N4_9ACTN|nr:hypothetical protein EAS64_02485 [Trebonia kvetii]
MPIELVDQPPRSVRSGSGSPPKGFGYIVSILGDPHHVLPGYRARAGDLASTARAKSSRCLCSPQCLHDELMITAMT